MVRALRSHGRCWLVALFWQYVMSVWHDVAVRHSYSNFLYDWPSVDHWLVNCAVRPEKSCVFCRTYTSVESLATKLAGHLKRPSPSTIALFHDITGSFTSCYKSHRLLTRLWLLQNVVLSTRLQYVVESSSISKQNLLIGCRPVTSSFSDDPLTQFTAELRLMTCIREEEEFTAKPFLRC